VIPLPPFRTAAAFGALLALSHAFWAVLVLVGWAQPLTDFIFRLHFIEPPWTISPFNWAGAITLVAFTGAVGALVGLVVALVWNAAQRWPGART
jgi:hypothetical protein